jgi:hypothetical protein
MTLTIIKDTIEIDSLVSDSNGDIFIQKRINLKEGYAHELLQTDIFWDGWLDFAGQRTPFEVVISPYPQIPTNMSVSAAYPSAKAYTAAGDDTVLFKASGLGQNFGFENPTYQQFPSKEIASTSLSTFYTDHVYVSIHVIHDAEHFVGNIRMSFMLTLNNRKISNLTSSMGQLAENHDAMCAQVMNNGRMVTRANLQGNVFPWWRYGGIRPELMISPEAAGSFFLQMPATDEELMQNTGQIRSAVADARSMGAYDAAFGARFPDWCRFGLNAGLVAGAIRDQWPPIKHADNGNVLCL